MQDINTDFKTIVTDNAQNIQMVFISDLHLSLEQPALMRAFLQFLDLLNQLPNLKQLYILGDWFDAWLGDDLATIHLDTMQPDTNHLPQLQSNLAQLQNWLAPMIDKLTQLHKKSCQIFIMRGNRDFLLGQTFCQTFGGTLLAEPHYLNIDHSRYRLEHGDRLCTDDKAYQRFRRLIQNPISKRLLLMLSSEQRQAIAKKLRNKSQQDNAKKSMQIMDVNESAVQQALKQADILIHGHTHRPAIHQIPHLTLQKNNQNKQKKRVVLGDWRLIKQNNPQKITITVEAVVGVVLINQHKNLEFQLSQFIE